MAFVGAGAVGLAERTGVQRLVEDLKRKVDCHNLRALGNIVGSALHAQEEQDQACLGVWTWAGEGKPAAAQAGLHWRKHSGAVRMVPAACMC